MRKTYRKEIEIGDVCNVFIAGILAGYVAYVSILAFFVAVTVFGSLILLVTLSGK